MTEYKLSKPINILLKGIPRLPEVRHKLLIPTDMIHNRNTRNKQQNHSTRKKKPIGKRQIQCQRSQTWNSTQNILEVPKYLANLDQLSMNQNLKVILLQRNLSRVDTFGANIFVRFRQVSVLDRLRL